jgi:Protein of unknown function (DUF2846)
MKTIALLILLASPVFAQETPATNNPLWACGPAATQFDVTVAPPADVVPVQVPEAGKALVYVIRDVEQGDCFGACKTTIRVGLDGAWAGATQGRTYFSFAVSPGEHHLCANWQSRRNDYSALTSLANFTAVSGETYYFRIRIVSSNRVPQLDLEQTNRDEARYLVSFSNLAVSHTQK